MAAVEGAVRAQGEGQVVLEPRVHLAPPNGGARHFNVLRGHLGPEHVSGVKVVGDFVGNWRLGLPSQLALVLLDPDTEVLLETGWVVPGTTVIPYGTVSAVDLDLVDVMDKVVVDDWGQATVGPLGVLRRHVDSGRLGRHNLHAERGEIVAGQAPGRERLEERTLFWHRGLATTDLAVAWLFLRRAADAGLDTLLRYR
jgi:ornithine cyclodeaminase/alanine dehydrogenase-like protein (mu-crystallin family)